MPSQETLFTKFFRAFWAGARGPMLERGTEVVSALAALVWTLIRARNGSISESWDSGIQIFAPLLWLICSLFSWHILKGTYILVRKSQGRYQRIQILGMTMILLVLPIAVVTLTWPNPDSRAPRHLTSKQKEQLVSTLLPYKGQKYALEYAHNDGEVFRFAEDFDEVFNRAGWSKVIYGPLWAPVGFPESFRFPNQFGVQWYIADRALPNPVYSTLRTVLRERCSIIADGVRWPDPQMRMDPEVIYVYVGTKFQ